MPCSSLFTRALLLAPLALPLTALASPSGDALRALAQDDWVVRSVSLAELGISNPVVLEQSDNHQAFFLPVPRGVPLSQAQVEVQGSFIKGERVAPTLKMSIDGRPLLARRIDEAEGDLARNLPVEARGHESGFVNFSIDWSSPTGERLCEPTRQTANVLTVSPDTRLTYRFPMSALSNLTDAWNTLPGKPVILIANGKLDARSFDSAWRLGVTLERAAKRAQVRALPAVGDSVSLKGVSVPPALTGVPAFAALAGAGRHTLNTPAELGALLLLDAPATRADLAIADDALKGQLDSALQALREQLQGDADALKAFDDWRARRASLASKTFASQHVALASLGGQALIAVAADAGAKASGLFDNQWRNVLTAPEATVHAAGGSLNNDQRHLRLSNLGGSHTTFDVVTRGEWAATFPLSAVSVDGHMPGELVLDLAAAPGASSTRPVASVIWNGVLLNARQLDANGQAERLSARVPGYALGVNNTLQVQFQRQPVSPNCAEIPQGFPVNVLPSSYLQAASAEPDGTFVGLLPLLAGEAQVIVPSAALQTPAASLNQVIRLATAASISPVKAELTLADPAQPFAPSKPFLSLLVPLQGAKPLVDVQDAERLRAQNHDQLAVDVQGPQDLSAVSVVASAGQNGVVWYALGAQPVVPHKAFVLTRGNAVVLGANGPLIWVDTTDPELNLSASPFHQWRKYLVWALPTFAAILLLLLVLGVLARSSRLKHKGK
ncbi:hypothetical protein DCO48_10675 [Pseudomonas sp. SDI]|nr:hypothetical protein DCO48_10675 [Pseudomonas sp. SDI]